MKIFETVSFHIVKPCNFSCKYCYATFNDIKNVFQMSLEDCKIIIDKLYLAGVEKITFAGGEPMLYKHVDEAIIYTKSLGITTSIISNGSLFTEAWLDSMIPHLDWIGVSIDSLSNSTNMAIGRTGKSKVNYVALVQAINERRFKLKINTVVNRYNENEIMQEFITWANPDRWKIFDTLRVEGQNNTQFDEIRTSALGFIKFTERHNHPSMVVEDNEAMTASYLLIDPRGRMFENSQGKHTYSDSLITHETDHCLSQINLNRETFIKRGGLYKWD